MISITSTLRYVGPKEHGLQPGAFYTVALKNIVIKRKCFFLPEKIIDRYVYVDVPNTAHIFAYWTGEEFDAEWRQIKGKRKK